MITAAVITKDEEENLADCLASVRWADELLVLDAYSADATLAVARQYTDQIFQRPFVSFAHQRNGALGLARGDWVFFVDADERATEALAAEVRQVAEAQADAAAGYWVPRRNLILGKWVRYGGWYPDYQLRLLRKGRAAYDETRPVHELVKLEGPAGYLKETLWHYNYRRLGQLFQKQDLYATYEARGLYLRGQRARPHNCILQPWREFRRRYFQLEGYRDGWRGLLLSGVLAYYTFVTYARLARMGSGEGLAGPKGAIRGEAVTPDEIADAAEVM